LKGKGFLGKNLPGFPKKRSNTSSLSKTFVEERKKCLHDYMKCVCSLVATWDCSEIVLFLDNGENILLNLILKYIENIEPFSGLVEEECEGETGLNENENDDSDDSTYNIENHSENEFEIEENVVKSVENDTSIRNIVEKSEENSDDDSDDDSDDQNVSLLLFKKFAKV